MDVRGDLLYFFLSYARLAPMPVISYSQTTCGPATHRVTGGGADGSETDLDPDVQSFFDDLDAEIKRRTRRYTTSGFYDHHIPFDVDPRKVLADALSRAQVFVSLYSPSYLTTSWPRREQKAFRIRMRAQGQEPDDRIVPVLWTPIPLQRIGFADRRQFDQAHALASDLPEYQQNGLRVLRTMGLIEYKSAYQKVLARVATRIINVTETAVVPRSEALDFDQVPESPTADPSFILTELTDDPEAEASSSWHPYRGRQGLPIMDYAIRTAERFGLAPLVVLPDEFAVRSEGNPALAIVDPCVLRHPHGLERLCRFFQGLPMWVRLLVVGNAEDSTIDALATRAQGALSSAVPVGVNHPPGHVVERVDGPRDLESTLTAILARARQAYLKHGEYESSPPLTPRPRLSGGDSKQTRG